MALSEQQVTALKEIGSEWQKNGMHRIYVNDLARWYGLEVSRYNTGNISGATLDGEGISNGKAKQIDSRLSYAKLYYDVTTGRFAGRNMDQADFDRIVERIKTKVNSQMQEVA